MKRPMLAAQSIVGLGIAVTLVLHWFPSVLVPSSGPYSTDPAVLHERIVKVVGDGVPRAVDTPGAAAGRERIRSIFPPELVLEEHTGTIDRGVHPRVRLVNLVGRIKGTDPSAGTIAVVAHSDSVAAGPGASDDGAGVVAVATIAHDLVKHPPRHDVIVVLTDGEEAGLLGAQMFMGNHPWAPEVQGVLNLDARGAAGPAFVFEFGPNTMQLVDLMKKHLNAPRTTGLAAWIYAHMPNSTDFLVFKRAGVTGYNVAFIGDHAAYHTPQDTVERQSASTLAHMTHTGLALMRALDEMEPWQNTLMKQGVGDTSTRDERLAALNRERLGATASENGTAKAAGSAPAKPEAAAWTDIAGFWIIAWPERLSLWLAVACGLAAVAEGAWLVRSAGRDSPSARRRAIGTTVGGALLVLVVAGGLGFLAAFGAARAGVNTHNLPVQTLLLQVVVWLAAAVLVMALGAALAGRATERDGRPLHAAPECAYAGVWIVWAVVAIMAGWFLPAAGPLVVLPIFCALIGARCGRMTPTRNAVVRGSLAGLAGTVFVWMPLEPAFYDALGPTIAPVTAVRAVLILLPVVPLITLAAKRDWLGSNQQPSVS